MTPRILTLALPAAVWSLAGCDTNNKGGDTGPGGADGGDGGEIVYDEGCILVDGGGGYAWINDAIAVAEDGATIELCADSGHEEAVVVDKAVTIVGPGSDAFLLVAPVNSTGVEITAAGASVSGLTVQTTRTAVAVEAADDVTLDDISVTSAGNWGVRATDSAGLTLSNLNLLGNGVDGINYGGLLVSGGSATVSDSLIQGSVGYGVWADDGASVGISGSDISSTSEYEAGDTTNDGVGVYVTNGAEVSSSGNVYTGNVLAGGWTDGGDLSMSGDELYGGVVGAYVLNGAATYTDLVVQDSEAIGLLAVGTDPIVISNCTVSTDPATSLSIPYDQYPNESIGGTGIFVSGMDVTVDQISVTGFNDAGLFLEGRDTGATATVSTATLTDNGRYGVFVNNGIVTTLNDVDISGTRLVDELDDRRIDLDSDGVAETDPLCYYVNYWAAVYSLQSTVTMIGGSISGSEGWGVSSLRGSFDATGVDFEGGHCAGTISYEGVLSVRDSTFTNRGTADHILSQDDSAVVLEGNAFSANQFDGEYAYTVDYVSSYGYRYTYTYAPGFAAGYDARILGAASIDIADNSFESGGYGLYLAGTTGSVSNNTWSDYRSSALTVASYIGSDGTTDRGGVTVDTATMSNVGGRMLYCSNANLELEQVSIDQGAAYAYSYDYLQESDSDGDGEVDSEFSFSSSSNVTNVGLYSFGCDLVLDDVSVSGLEGNGVELQSSSLDTTVEVLGLEISEVGSVASGSEAGFRVYANQGSISLNLAEVSIEDSGALQGLSLFATGDGVIDLVGEDVAIDGTGDEGVYLRGHGASAELVRLVVANASTDGVQTQSGSLTIAGTSITDSAEDGLLAFGDLDGDGFTIADGDCNDNSSAVYPGRPETLGNFYDDDCDGAADDGTDTSDNDGDGYTIADGDCNDLSYSGDTIYPGAPERRDGLDNDCDGVADDGVGTTITISGLTVSRSGGSGAILEDVAVSSSSSAFSSNAGWGMECEDTTFSTCAETSLTDNGLGGHSGCDATCGL